MPDRPSLVTWLARNGRALALPPWPRVVLDRAGWQALAERLAGEDWSLIGLWAEPDRVHAAFRDEGAGELAAVRLDCPDGQFPSLSAVRPGAIRLERAAQDLFGVAADGLTDDRPWLDHGVWLSSRPLAGARPAHTRRAPRGPDYPFLPAEGEGLHQIPVGPVHAGIIEPGHFRFTLQGEAVVRLEARLGYVHKGIEGLMAGKPVADAARLAARISGDSTVGHSLAFARAVEAALGIEAPDRAHHLRALMAELERIANHLGDVGAICNDAAFAFLQAHLTVWRERVLRLCERCFGHRLMMDRVVPGGVAVDLDPDGAAAARALVDALEPAFARLMRVYDGKPSLLDRTVSTGVTLAELVHRFAAGGFVGRAAGRQVDARRSPGYPPYDALDFDVPVMTEGDVHARLMVRATEIAQSIGIVRQILDTLPRGDVTTALPPGTGAGNGEGIACVEGFRGDILTYVRLDGSGRVQRCHPRDPSWFQWPLLEAAIHDNIVADFPLCNKSFNCSYSGHDL